MLPKDVTLMFKHGFIAIVLVFTALMIWSCTGIVSNTDNNDKDSVIINKITLTDTAQFNLVSGGICTVSAKVNVAYPEESLHQLQKLFIEMIFGCEGESDMENSVHKYLQNSLAQYGISKNEHPEHIEPDYKATRKYSINTNVNILYNKNKVLSVVKTIITIKDNDTTMITNEYFNFDLATMHYIQIDDIFKVDKFDNLTELLKKKLMQINGVYTEEDLVDIGYFNLENLRVHNNFRICEDGVIWTFLPYEIAMLQVGEVELLLTYDELEEYINDECDLISRVN